MDCLDVMTELLKRFGPAFEAKHNELTKLVVQQLRSPQPVVRKRSIACLGQLAVHVSDPLLQSMVKHLLAGIKDATDAPTLIPPSAPCAGRWGTAWGGTWGTSSRCS